MGLVPPYGAFVAGTAVALFLLTGMLAAGLPAHRAAIMDKTGLKSLPALVRLVLASSELSHS